MVAVLDTGITSLNLLNVLLHWQYLKKTENISFHAAMTLLIDYIRW